MEVNDLSLNVYLKLSYSICSFRFSSQSIKTQDSSISKNLLFSSYSETGFSFFPELNPFWPNQCRFYNDWLISGFSSFRYHSFSLTDCLRDDYDTFAVEHSSKWFINLSILIWWLQFLQQSEDVFSIIYNEIEDKTSSASFYF